MRLSELLRQLFSTPPHLIYGKATRLIQRRWNAYKTRETDHARTTYLTSLNLSGQVPFHFLKRLPLIA